LTCQILKNAVNFKTGKNARISLAFYHFEPGFKPVGGYIFTQLSVM